METMRPPSYHHKSFVATQALVHMMHGYTLLVPVIETVLKKLSKEATTVATTALGYTV